MRFMIKGYFKIVTAPNMKSVKHKINVEERNESKFA